MNTRPINLAEMLSNTRVRTLVVDDSPLMLKVLAQFLEKAGGFDLVGTAINGCQALRHVAALSPELVLMDFHLPRLSGVQATRYIKEGQHPPVVIIVSSDGSSVARSMAENAGADGFIVKARHFSLRLARMLEDLFGPGGARRAAGSGISFQNPPAGQANQEHGT
jgi:DNA-binding NarL/FixJ family response regulator